MRIARMAQGNFGDWKGAVTSGLGRPISSGRSRWWTNLRTDFMTTKVRSKSRAKARARAKTDVPVGYRRWDAANYLKSEEDMAAYLEAAMEEAPDDSAFITAVLADIARARGIMQLANDTGMTRAGLYKALTPGSKPSLEIIVKISKALGLRLSLKPAA